MSLTNKTHPSGSSSKYSKGTLKLTLRDGRKNKIWSPKTHVLSLTLLFTSWEMLFKSGNYRSQLLHLLNGA